MKKLQRERGDLKGQENKLSGGASENRIWFRANRKQGGSGEVGP